MKYLSPPKKIFSRYTTFFAAKETLVRRIKYFSRPTKHFVGFFFLVVGPDHTSSDFSRTNFCGEFFWKFVWRICFRLQIFRRRIVWRTIFWYNIFLSEYFSFISFLAYQEAFGDRFRAQEHVLTPSELGDRLLQTWSRASTIKDPIERDH